MGAEDTTAPPFHAGALTGGDEEIDRDDGEGHEADIEVGGEHEGESHDRAGEERQDVDEEVLDGVAEAHDAAVDASLEFAGLVAVGGEEGHTEAEDAVNDTEGEVVADIDADFLAEDALAEGDDGSEEFLAKQDGADDEQEASRLGPLERVAMEHGVDGVNSAVEDHSVDLRHERASEGEHQCDYQ